MADSDTKTSGSAEPQRHNPILVFGASGYIGRHLVPALRAEGYKVRAAARRLAPLEAEGWDSVELVQADAHDPDTLPKALNGVSTAYFLVHSMADGSDFPERERRAAATFAQAAEQAGVERIVYLGGLAPKDTASMHLASRVATGEELRRGQVPVSELRAPVIVGPGSIAFEVMRDLAAYLPIMVTPKWVRAESPPIALDDLLGDLVALPQRTPADNTIYETGGPEQLSYEQMLRTIARELGRPAPIIIPVPFVSPELSSYWLAFVSATPTDVARALIGGLKHDLSADDGPLRQRIPRDPMPFDAAVRRAFEKEKAFVAHTRWREGAFNLRGERQDIGYYAKKMSRAATTPVDVETLWRALSDVGTREAGYFFLSGLWEVRKGLDRLLGGRPAGHRRPGRAPEPGERFDMWEVLAAERPKRLTLKIRAVVPGRGGLEFEIDETQDGHSRLTATMYWHPAGAPGLLYWYKLGPPHAVLLQGMVARICQRAEASRAAHPRGSRPGLRPRPAR
ncbi:DUF2867 domain-containing protein [Rhodovibrio salinarum]|uniref:DUF2867 domain-containing protein n=1 Tax=Rhodovibrio salinarum TaxID=1087 RepID=A0A934V121_9PROT|nr:DUF2867 domain-containing protein [Rhodovibrio salinarum]MBK1698110.1 DUF2867 domain-containing protein [Rhodovibrio salinarum]